MKRLTTISILLAALGASPLAAQPQSNLFIGLGVFPTSFSSSARLSSEQQEGTEVDLEHDLGFDSNASNIRLEGFWRFKPRHRLEFGYTSWRRTAEKTITEDIQWGDKHFEVGAAVQATNNAQFIKLAYRYSLYRTDRTEFDVSAGFDTVWNKASIEGEATIIGENGQEVTGFYEEENSYIAPAPVLGFSVSHLVIPTVLLRGSVEYFQATFEGTTGKILDFRGSADYLFNDTWGVGAGYTWVGYKVERERFDATYDFSGPLLYVTYRR